MQETQVLKVAEKLRKNSAEIEAIKIEIYEELERALGEEYNVNRAWWGPKSENFLRSLQKKKDDFDATERIVNSMAEILESGLNELENL